MAIEKEVILNDKGHTIEKIPCGSTIEIEISEVEGYSFTQWNYVDEKGKTQTINGNSIKIPVNCSYELIPVYKQEKYTIMINDDDETKQYGGSYYKGETLLKYTTGDAIEADYNESITIIPYEREGYHFTEWVCEPMDNVRTDENGNLIISPITTSYVITPQYEINTYELTISIPTNINLNGDTTISVNLTKNDNQPSTLILSENTSSQTVSIDYNTEVELEVVSTTINNTYNFTGWKINNSTINSPDPLTITMTQNYTIQLQYTEMVELTFIKPDYVTNFKIEYTIGENENSEEINFGDEETQIVKYLPKHTDIKVKAESASSETATNIPCGGWEKDGVFTVPETTASELVINDLSNNTTIKPIYCYNVELHVRTDYKTGITNNEVVYNKNLVTGSSIWNEIRYDNSKGICLVQNGDMNAVANLSSTGNIAYLADWQNDVGEPYESYNSSILYKPKTNITCKATVYDEDLPYNDSDDTYDIDVSCDSWWVKDGNDNYQLLSSQRTLTIDQLLSNKVIYGALLPLNKTIGVRFYYKNGSNTYEQITNGGSYSKFFKVSSNSPIENNIFLNWRTNPDDNSKYYDYSTKTNLKISDISPVGLILDVEYQHSSIVPENEVPGIKYQWTAERIQGGMGSQNAIVGTYPGTVQVPQYIQIGGANDIDDININNNNNNINNNRNNNGTWITDLSNTIQTKTIKIPVVTAFSELVEPQQTQKAVPSGQYDQIWLNIYLDPIPN